MTFNPYKILGVKRKANSEEIRAAYIAKAKVLHPDAGGGEEEFKELQQAYALLTNPAARDRYDRDGFVEGDPQSEIRASAMRNLGDIFSQIMDSIPEHELPRVDIIDAMRQSSKNALQRHEKIVFDLETKRRKFERQLEVIRKRLKRKKRGDNFFITVLEKKIEGVEAEIHPAKHLIKIIECAIGMLDNYEFEVYAENFPAFSGFMIRQLP